MQCAKLPGKKGDGWRETISFVGKVWENLIAMTWNHATWSPMSAISSYCALHRSRPIFAPMCTCTWQKVSIWRASKPAWRIFKDILVTIILSSSSSIKRCCRPCKISSTPPRKPSWAMHWWRWGHLRRRSTWQDWPGAPGSTSWGRGAGSSPDTPALTPSHGLWSLVSWGLRYLFQCGSYNKSDGRY